MEKLSAWRLWDRTLSSGNLWPYCGLKSVIPVEKRWKRWEHMKSGTRDGSRTRKVYNRLILSQVRMPFRHPGVIKITKIYRFFSHFKSAASAIPPPGPEML